MIDTDPNLLYAHHLSATDVSLALSQQNLIVPAGTARLGDKEFIVKTNSSPTTISAFNDLPIRASNGTVTYMKDVAQVHNGFATQTNIVRGKRQAVCAAGGAEKRQDFNARYRVASKGRDSAAGCRDGDVEADAAVRSVAVRAQLH